MLDLLGEDHHSFGQRAGRRVVLARQLGFDAPLEADLGLPTASGLLPRLHMRGRVVDHIAEQLGNDARRTGQGAAEVNAGWICPAESAPVPGPGMISTSLRRQLEPLPRGQCLEGQGHSWATLRRSTLQRRLGPSIPPVGVGPPRRVQPPLVGLMLPCVHDQPPNYCDGGQDGNGAGAHAPTVLLRRPQGLQLRDTSGPRPPRAASAAASAALHAAATAARPEAAATSAVLAAAASAVTCATAAAAAVPRPHERA